MSTANNPSASGVSTIPLAAGLDAAGQPVLEEVKVSALEDQQFRIEQTPAFVKGTVKGDIVRFDEGSNSFFIVRHSGNLAVRVYAREDMQTLEKDLVPRIEKLGGSLEFANQRLLVFAIHVSIGFKQIEALLDDTIDESEGQLWLYGNVYDPEDGQTPLNWWLPLLEET